MEDDQMSMTQQLEQLDLLQDGPSRQEQEFKAVTPKIQQIDIINDDQREKLKKRIKDVQDRAAKTQGTNSREKLTTSQPNNTQAESMRQ